jgi:hypothetical protein
MHLGRDTKKYSLNMRLPFLVPQQVRGKIGEAPF